MRKNTLTICKTTFFFALFSTCYGQNNTGPGLGFDPVEMVLRMMEETHQGQHHTQPVLVENVNPLRPFTRANNDEILPNLSPILGVVGPARHFPFRTRAEAQPGTATPPVPPTLGVPIVGVMGPARPFPLRPLETRGPASQ